MEPTKKEGKTAGLRKVTAGSGMEDNYVDDCSVCFTAFDDTIQRPRCLPCGHIFCTPCVNGLMIHGQVKCPICCIDYAVPEAGHFPVCYALENVIQRLKGAALDSTPLTPRKDTAEPATSPTGPGQKVTAGLSKKIKSLVQEQEAKILETIRTCQEVQAQLDQYRTTLDGWGDQQQQLEDRLLALVERSKSARALVRQGKTQVAAKKEQVRQGEQQLHTMLQTLRRVHTGRDAYQAIDDAEQCTDEEKERAEECLAMFPDGHAVNTIRRTFVVSKAAVKGAQTMEESSVGTVSNPRLPADHAATITERLMALAPTLKANDLRTLTQPTRNLLLEGLLFATHNTEGQCRHASISLEDGRLYLHSLQNQTLPLGAVTLQMDEVVPAAPPCLVFLDLTWPGTSRRRVLIRLNPDTGMGRQFVLLCTGQRGPSYANTRLHALQGKGKPGEYVCGGDYEGKNGKGGDALLPDLNKGDYRGSGKAGDVSRLLRVGGDDTDWNTQFAILTRDKEKGQVWPRVFGEVVDGLGDLAAAAQHIPVAVMDCGVVLWE